MPLCLIHIKENLIATGSKDGMVKIWDNNREICEFKEHIGGVCCMTVIR
jgi:WD40 repeat protein